MSKTSIIIIGLVLIAISFTGGMYAQKTFFSKTNNFRSGQDFAQGGANRRGGANGQGMGSGMAGGGMTVGKVLSMTDGNLVVDDGANGTKLVIIGSTTQYSANNTITKDQIKEGDTITVRGQKNNDGSVKAENVILGELQFGADKKPVTNTDTQSTTNTK